MQRSTLGWTPTQRCAYGTSMLLRGRETGARLHRSGTHSLRCGLMGTPETRRRQTMRAPASSVQAEQQTAGLAPIAFKGVHHVAVICANLERSMAFYEGLLGLEINPARPHDKLPYRGAWLWVGPEMIHLMELPNPDPMDGRPEHGGRDRHFCTGVDSIQPLVARLDAAGVPYTMSRSGRPAVFFRDPDMNTLEVVEQESWR